MEPDIDFSETVSDFSFTFEIRNLLIENNFCDLQKELLWITINFFLASNLFPIKGDYLKGL